MTRISPSTSSGVEAIGMAQMGLFEAEPARFEGGEHRLDAPPRGIIEGGQIARLGRHGDDPGLGMSRIANDADVCRDPLAGEGDSLEIVAAGQSEAAGCGLCRAPAGEKIAPEPQPIIPSPIATPPDHRGGSVEAGSELNPPKRSRQPAGDDREQLFLRVEAN